MSMLSNIGKNLVKNVLLKPLRFNNQIFRNCKDQPPATNALWLDPLKKDSYTFRRHDNNRRQQLYEFGMYVAACMPKYVQLVQMQHNDDLEICVHPEGLFPVLSFMRKHQHASFEACSIVTAVDVPSREYRFEVVYCLLSLRFVAKARIKTYCDELTPLHSAFELYNVAHTFERECYDMFGVVFLHHPDLRRLLTDYGFRGHPLRKDFPVVGYTEIRYDDELKKLVWDPIEFSQEGRSFTLNTPWSYERAFHEGYDVPEPPTKKM